MGSVVTGVSAQWTQTGLERKVDISGNVYSRRLKISLRRERRGAGTRGGREGEEGGEGAEGASCPWKGGIYSQLTHLQAFW